MDSSPSSADADRVCTAVNIPYQEGLKDICNPITHVENLKYIILQGIHNLGSIHSLSIESQDKEYEKQNSHGILLNIKLNNTPFVIKIFPHWVDMSYYFVQKTVCQQLALIDVPIHPILEIHVARDENDMNFLLLSKYEGIQLDNYLESFKEKEYGLIFECGVNLAKIHSLHVQKFGYFDSIQKNRDSLIGTFNSHHEFIMTNLELHLNNLENMQYFTKDISNRYRNIFAKQDFEPIDGPRLIHNNYADWSIATNGKIITDIMHWEKCHAGDPVFDIAKWATMYSADRLKALIEGYISVTSLPDNFKEKLYFYRIFHILTRVSERLNKIF